MQNILDNLFQIINLNFIILIDFFKHFPGIQELVK